MLFNTFQALYNKLPQPFNGTNPPIEGSDGDQVCKQNYPSHAHTMEDLAHGAGDRVVPKYI